MIDQHAQPAGSTLAAAGRLRIVRIDLREQPSCIRGRPEACAREIASRSCDEIESCPTTPPGASNVLSSASDAGNRFEAPRIRLDRVEVGRVVGAVPAQLDQHRVAMPCRSRTARYSSAFRVRPVERDSLDPVNGNRTGSMMCAWQSTMRSSLVAMVV
jgi:hypothetical protein